MGIQIVSISEPQRQGLPDWLDAFEWITVEPGGDHERGARGRCLLLYVVDGVLDRGHGPPGLRRSLPGEVIVIRGRDAVTLANGSHVESLQFLVIGLSDEPAAAAQINSRYFSDDDKSGAFRLVASEQGEAGALAHGGRPRLSLTCLDRGDTVVHEMAAAGSGWACVIAGSIAINNVALEPGQCALISDVEDLRVSAADPAQVLLIEHNG